MSKIENSRFISVAKKASTEALGATFTQAIKRAATKSVTKSAAKKLATPQAASANHTLSNQKTISQPNTKTNMLAKASAIATTATKASGEQFVFDYARHTSDVFSRTSQVIDMFGKVPNHIDAIGINGSAYNDTFIANVQKHTNGGALSQYVYGNGGNDWLLGKTDPRNESVLYLNGGDGDDVVIGNSMANNRAYIMGGNGSDILTSIGSSRIITGEGNDTIYVGSHPFTEDGNHIAAKAEVRIADFNPLTDKLNVSTAYNYETPREVSNVYNEETGQLDGRLVFSARYPGADQVVILEGVPYQNLWSGNYAILDQGTWNAYSGYNTYRNEFVS